MFTRLGVYIGLGSVLIALAEGGTAGMYDTVLNYVRKAQLVGYARVEKTSRVNVEGMEFLRVEVRPTELLKGAPAPESLIIDIHFAGKETPALEDGEEYLFFLRPFDSGPAGRLRTVEGTRPRRVSPPLRARFTDNLKKYVALAAGPPDEAAIKRLIGEMLRSQIPFFETDAALTADGVSHWSAAELQSLAALLEDKKGELPFEALQNLTAVIAREAEPAFLETFAARRIEDGATESIYYGLVNRRSQDYLTVVRNLFNSSKSEVRLGAVRLAGLLRNASMIDSFERQLGPKPDAAARQAIEAARELARRVL